MTPTQTLTAVILTLTLAPAAGQTPALAVSDGRGDLLLIPYYTVEDGRKVLLTVTNHSADVKIVRLAFLEARNSRTVQSVNLFLSAFDVWVGAVQATGTDPQAGAMLLSADSSCTAPAIPTAGDPAEGLAFHSANYTGPQDDQGGTTLARTREGYILIIDQGVLEDSTLAGAATHTSLGCSTLHNAYRSGVWALSGGDLGFGVSAPSGALSAAWEIIRVSSGESIGARARAWRDFFVPTDPADTLHGRPGDVLPDVTSGTQQGAHRARFLDTATGAWVVADFDSAADALSATIMRSALAGEYTVNPDVGAATDWLLTFPTKSLYTDTDVVAPFTGGPFSQLGHACENVLVGLWDRDEAEAPAALALCAEANVVTFGGGDSTVLGALSTQENLFLPWEFTAGWARVDLAAQGLRVLTSQGGVWRLHGLPVVGYSALTRNNAQIGAGAVYSVNVWLTGERANAPAP